MLVSEYQKAIHICEALQNKGKKVTANKIVKNSLFFSCGSLAHVDKSILKKIAQMYAKNAITEQHLQRYERTIFLDFIISNGVENETTIAYRRVIIQL